MNTMDIDYINELIALKDFAEAKICLEKLTQSLASDSEPYEGVIARSEAKRQSGKNKIDYIEALKLLGLCNINLGQFNAGKNNFETVVKYKNDDALSWFYLASAYDNLEDFLHAKTAYLEVIKLRENYLDAYKNLCIVYIKTKEQSKAIELAKKALEFVQDDYIIYYLIGTAHLSMKEYQESIPYFEKALTLNPEHSQLYNNIGTAYLSTKDYDKAYESYIKASELDPENSITFYNIASILQIKNKHKEACKFFQKAYDIEPLEHYLVSLALSEFKSAQYEAAISHYKILISQHPEKQNFQYNLACCYEIIGEYTFAIGILSQLVLLNPKSTSMAQKLANLYLKVNQPLKAKEIYQKIIGHEMVSSDIYYEYALICASTNDLDTAETILKKVVELNPDFAQAHKDLGVIYLNKRLFNYAKDEFEQACKLLPNDANILFEYANFLHSISEFKKAQEFYKKVIEQNPEDINALAFSALNSISMNDLENAKHDIETALKALPESDFILFLAGKINYLLKDFDKAQLFLVKSYEINPTIEVKNLLALNYYEQGEFEQANIIFLSLLRDNPKNTNLLLNSAQCYHKLSDFKSAKKQLKIALEIFPEFDEAKELLNKVK